MINEQKLRGQWNELTGRIKKKWGSLTDDELQQTAGEVDQLIGLIQRSTGESREAIEHHLEQLMEEGASAVGRAAESARQYAQQTGETIWSGYEHTEEMVRSRPTESLAIAFGVGLLSGLIVGLTLRSR